MLSIFKVTFGVHWICYTSKWQINVIYRNAFYKNDEYNVREIFLFINIYRLIHFRNNLMHEYDAMNNEIHIKIGGDHGDKSFKMSFQVKHFILIKNFWNISFSRSKSLTTKVFTFLSKSYLEDIFNLSFFRTAIAKTQTASKARQYFVLLKRRTRKQIAKQHLCSIRIVFLICKNQLGGTYFLFSILNFLYFNVSEENRFFVTCMFVHVNFL